MLDYMTINETSSDCLPTDDDSNNGAKKIMHEATKIRDSILYQCQDKKNFFDLEEEDPFIEVEDQIAIRNGYIYQIWPLPRGKKICIRSVVNAYIKKKEDEPDGPENRTYINVYPFLEYEPNKSNWKLNLDVMMA